MYLETLLILLLLLV